MNKVVDVIDDQKMENGYSSFCQKTVKIFKEAQKHGAGIVGRTILENRFLAGKYVPEDVFRGMITDRDGEQNVWIIFSREIVRICISVRIHSLLTQECKQAFSKRFELLYGTDWWEPKTYIDPIPVAARLCAKSHTLGFLYDNRQLPRTGPISSEITKQYNLFLFSESDKIILWKR